MRFGRLRFEGWGLRRALLGFSLLEVLFRSASHSNLRVSDQRALTDEAEHGLPQSDRHFANFGDFSELLVAPAAQQVPGVREQAETPSHE